MKTLRNISFGCIGIVLLICAGCMSVWDAAEIDSKDTPEIAAQKLEIAKYVAEIERLKGQLEAERLTAELRLETEREEFRMRLKAAEEALWQEIFPARYFYFAGLGVIGICALLGLIWRFALGGDMRHAIGIGFGGVAVGGSLIGIASLHQSHPWVLQIIPVLIVVIVAVGAAYMAYEWIVVGRKERAVQIMAQAIETGYDPKATIKERPDDAAFLEGHIRKYLPEKKG